MKKTRITKIPLNRYREQYGVIVLCKDEKEQIKVYAKLLKKGYRLRVVVT